MNSSRIWSRSIALLLVLVFLCSLGLVCATSSTSGESLASVQAYLQNEALALSEAQQQISSFLISKNIPIKSLSLSRDERKRLAALAEKSKSRVCMSTEENEVECRISLDTVDIGKKCIAPCGCVGSQRWIQFSEFNRLRRKEPSKWVTCQTCQQNFDYSIISKQSVDVKTALLSTTLDKPVIVRSILAVTVMVTSVLFSLDKVILRLITSRFFWQRYHHVSKLVHLPLVLKLWGGRVALQYIAQFYGKFEGKLMEALCEVETQALEDCLKVEEE